MRQVVGELDGSNLLGTNSKPSNGQALGSMEINCSISLVVKDVIVTFPVRPAERWRDRRLSIKELARSNRRRKASCSLTLRAISFLRIGSPSTPPAKAAWIVIYPLRDRPQQTLEPARVPRSFDPHADAHSLLLQFSVECLRFSIAVQQSAFTTFSALNV
jgi:hypothetical protein